MRIEGTISKIYELKEGVSKTNGNTWMSRDIVLTWTEEMRSSDGSSYEREQCMTVTLRGENAKNFGLGVDTKVQVNVSFKTNDYNGRSIQNIYGSSIFVM